MGRVCVWLPPFAGDYSGVCSALFDLGGLIVIHDANGCTGNYTHFDEPRWYGSDSMVYCSGYRKLDAVLGNDEHIMKRIQTAAEEMHPGFIAIVGSPVPNVVGFDFNGVAKALEKRTGLPVFGFPTMGIKGSYKDGVVMGVKALTDRFAADEAGDAEKAKQTEPAEHAEGFGENMEITESTEIIGSEETGKDVKNGCILNVLGATPLDIDQQNFNRLCDMLREHGFTLQVSEGNYGCLNQMKEPKRACLSLAFNQAGLELGQYIEEKYGVPYLAGFPIGRINEERYFNTLESCITEKRSGHFITRKMQEGGYADQIQPGFCACSSSGPVPNAGPVMVNNVSGGSVKTEKRACIIGDAVIGSAIADFLKTLGLSADVFTIFGKSRGMEDFCSGYLHHEEQIVSKLEEDIYDIYAADPVILDLIGQVVGREGVKKLPLPMHAVSSRVCSNQNWLYTDEAAWGEKLRQTEILSLTEILNRTEILTE